MSQLPEKIFLIDASKQLVNSWQYCFSDWDSVEVIHGDYFGVPADAMVSPANSFGYMDGGLDLAIRYELGHYVEESVQQRIIRSHHGELPVGAAEIIATENKNWPYLICAPTMRVPADVSKTLNAYLAFRAILLAVANFNSANTSSISSLVCPGLGTGVGRLSPQQCAKQMKAAYLHCTTPAKIPGFQEAHSNDRALKST